jgi:hypothetical protein
MKTTLAVALAVAISTGKPFLNKFLVPEKKRVSFITLESGEETIKETADRICLASGVTLGDCDVRWCFRSPRLDDEAGFVAVRDALERDKPGLAVIDPVFLCMFGRGGASRTDVNSAGQALLRLANLCHDHGATILYVFHARKGVEGVYDRSLELDDLSGTGVQEAARQWILVNRRSRLVSGTGFHQLYLNVGGSTGQSGLYYLDVNEGVIDKSFGGRVWEPKFVTEEEAQSQNAEALPEKKSTVSVDRRQVVKDRIRNHFDQNPGPETQSNLAIRIEKKSNKKLVGELLRELLAEGFLEEAGVERVAGTNGRRTHAGYRRARRAESVDEPQPLNQGGSDTRPPDAVPGDASDPPGGMDMPFDL